MSGSHSRRITFDRNNTLVIHDETDMKPGRAFLHIARECSASQSGKEIDVKFDTLQITLSGSNPWTISRVASSERYNQKQDTLSLYCDFNGMEKTRIQWKDSK